MTYIDAPAVVDHACAVLSDTDSALDLGSFDGECVSSPDLCSRGLTFALWVMAFDPVQMTSDWFFLSSGGHSSSAHGIAFYQSASDWSFRFKLRTSTKYVGEAVVPNSKISKEMWFHLALVFDHNDGIKVYVNGNLSAESRDFQNEVKNDGEVNFVVGAASTSSGFSKAAFSDLRVYAGAMTPSQVMDVMTCNSLNVSFEITEVRQLQPPLDSALSFECRARGIPNPILEWELKGGNGESTVPSSSPQSVEQTTINVTECVTRSTLRVHSNSENFTIAVCRATSSGQELVKDLTVVMHRAETITTSAVTAAVTNQQSHQTTSYTKQPGGDVITVKPTQNGKTGTRGVTKSTDTTEASRKEAADRTTWQSSSTAVIITQTLSGSRVTPDPTPETIGEGEATIVTMDAADTMRADSGDTTREPDDRETPEPSVTMSSPNDVDGDDDLEETPGQKSKSKLTWLAPVGVCIALLGIPAAFVLHYICKKKNNSVHDLAALLSTKQVTVPRPKSIERYRGATPMAPPKATPIPTPTQQAIRMVDVHEVNDPFDLTESMEKNM
ncbi:uncharacterized protein LOC119729002 [Patiria miniata]|uniref:Ig-like domain-containing protein n=1 Tax=Patiria miniata TaxID=46514 RepID=A0A914A1B0_PATMI|nr:uncharacterized protein LOC119729002 [Patiria miniata]